MRRTVGRFVADRTLAEDLSQEALLRVHLCAAGFRGVPDGPAFAKWCISLARNTAIDGIRRERRRRVSAVDPDTLGDTADPESVALGLEREHLVQRRVRAAIAALPPASRQVVILHKIEGMPMEEIAAQLGAQVGTVRVRAHRGYVALARRLGLQT